MGPRVPVLNQRADGAVVVRVAAGEADRLEHRAADISFLFTAIRRAPKRTRRVFFKDPGVQMHHPRSPLTFAALLALVLTSCSPSKAQIQATHYATAAISAPVFQASRAIANKPGYFELNAFVASQLGRPIPDLKEADFLADTSGVQVPIAFFHENRSPMSIGILVDTSGSMKRKLDTVKLMLAEFINGLNPSDEVFLIAFSAKPQMLQPLTVNHQAVVQSLSQLLAFGQTSIYDSIVLAVGELGKGHQPSKAILLITDGIDKTSTVNEQEPLQP